MRNVRCPRCKTERRLPNDATGYTCSGCGTEWVFARCAQCHSTFHAPAGTESWTCKRCGFRNEGATADLASVVPERLPEEPTPPQPPEEPAPPEEAPEEPAPPEEAPEEAAPVLSPFEEPEMAEGSTAQESPTGGWWSRLGSRARLGVVAIPILVVAVVIAVIVAGGGGGGGGGPSSPSPTSRAEQLAQAKQTYCTALSELKTLDRAPAVARFIKGTRESAIQYREAHDRKTFKALKKVIAAADDLRVALIRNENPAPANSALSTALEGAPHC